MTNIALVVLDTLRKDAFDRYFDWIPGRRFEHAFTTANWTVPAHASLFTGRYASEVGVHADHLHCDCPEPTLAEQLASAGYTTRAFSANTNITHHFGFDRGFEDFRTPDPFDNQDKNLFDWRVFSKTTDKRGIQKYLKGVAECINGKSRTLPSLLAGAKLRFNDTSEGEYGGTREAISELDQMDIGSPEFLFCNLMEVHEPYRVPEHYKQVAEPPLTNSVGDITIDEVAEDQTRQAYDDSANYLSDIYRELFDHLTDKFDYVITVADHGELLGEDGAWAHEHGVHPALTNVPLVITGDEFSGEHTGTVSTLDVHQTILDLAGVEGESNGYSLLKNRNDESEYLIEYLGLTPWSRRKLENNGYGDQVDQYDKELFGYAGPEQYYGYQTIDEFEELGSSTVPNPKARLSELIDNRDVRRVETNHDVPDEIRSQLEDLGYA